VLENAGKLHFPFRRYQIQKVVAAASGRRRALPRVPAGRHRRGQPRHAAVPLRHRDAAGDRRRARRPAVPPARIQVNNRKVCEGFYSDSPRRHRPGAAHRRQARQDRPGRASPSSSSRPPAPPEPRPTRASSSPRSRPRTPRSPTQCASSASPTRCSTTASRSSSRVVETAREHAPGLVVAELKIARASDYYTGTVYETQVARLRAFRLDLLRRPLRQPRLRRQPALPRRRHLDRVSRMLGCSSATMRWRRRARCRPACWSPSHRRGPPGQRPDRGHPPPPRHPTEVAPTARNSASRSATPDQRGIPYVWFPGDPDTVKDIRSGDQPEARPTPGSPRPPTCTPRSPRPAAAVGAGSGQKKYGVRDQSVPAGGLGDGPRPSPAAGRPVGKRTW